MAYLLCDLKYVQFNYFICYIKFKTGIYFQQLRKSDELGICSPMEMLSIYTKYGIGLFLLKQNYLLWHCMSLFITFESYLFAVKRFQLHVPTTLNLNNHLKRNKDLISFTTTIVKEIEIFKKHKHFRNIVYLTETLWIVQKFSIQ